MKYFLSLFPGIDQDAHDDLSGIESKIDAEIGINQLRKELKSLPLHYKQVWLGVFYENLSERKIADRLNLTRRRVRTIRDRLFDIISKLI